VTLRFPRRLSLAARAVAAGAAALQVRP